jgi:predicted helicase
MKSISTPYTLPPLEGLLLQLRDSARTEREKGNYFENLVRAYFGYEVSFRELYSDAWTYAEWAKLEGSDGKDTGIDFVAKTKGANEIVKSLRKLELP